ncbi:uncharacterized protein BDW43DRAFT_321906 [Aspergillus alliaceus]|uniref:uncharacterized protein n=1 Tax=Petromyces alliaceus TaxID=209559 RepID=UPI0012A5B99A|nr:uncharacterized protein BDW43DRAFT_321906 [Aspergillus alliaceus]KAB8237547.1 hypothetical protein BDW43DRAFT_321906 [Aspergillus alliaceus]
MPAKRKRAIRANEAKPVKARRTSGGGIARSEALVTARKLTIPVDGEPPAWANYRSELGDTLPWFRAVQGGIYHKDGLCWGVLLDADSGDRCYIDEEVIITRIGGGCTKDKDGKLTRVKDQDANDTMVKSLLNSMEQKLPVGIIIGQGNTVLETKVPHPFNVMAYFRVSHVWFERCDGKNGAKVRFEKLDLTSKSWWAVKGSSPPPPREERDFKNRPESVQCGACTCTSFRIYNEGWMCLEPSCEQFFRVERLEAPAILTYDQRFLDYRLHPDDTVQPHHSLIPDLLSTLNEDDSDVSTIRVAWKGVVCPQCRKCISRKLWRGWKCSDDTTPTPGHPHHTCTFQKMLRMHPVPLRSVIDSLEISPQKRALIPDKTVMTPHVDDVSLAPYRMLVYTLPGVGHITHLVSNRTINSRPDGPDIMFQQLQQVELGLRRFPLDQSVVDGTLTAHFAVNYGMPYKYVVSVKSKGFDEAPKVILRALGRLKWATEKALDRARDIARAPNEMLVLGYFEGMKIGYHDDGESSLGPTIATLSLGAQSTMLIRMKSVYFNGRSKNNIFLAEDPVLPGCAFEIERQNLKTRMHNRDITHEIYDKELKEVLKGHKCSVAKPCIKLQLNHGDLVVMHGENLQKYYEHSVIPENKLRFALTARHIKADHVDPKDIRKGNFTLSGDQVYNGH